MNEQLSPREIEILNLISQGLTNKDIARKIHVSYNTVRTHVQNIFAKLAVSNRIQAVNKFKIQTGVLQEQTS